ncbi:MAG: cellulose biosynthesis protein BcsQ [bacterium]|jgi:cellulose biosynthesis protein BcsQ
MIISFVQTKGGTGKSTLAMNITFSKAVTNNFKSVALVELDAQGTLKTWWKERIEEGRKPHKVSFYHISSTNKEEFQKEIQAIAQHNELIIMDVPGESTGKLHTQFACASSDLVLIPMRTSTNDESAFANNLLPMIKEIIRIDHQKDHKFQVIPTFVHPQSNRMNIVNYFNDILPEEVECLNVVYPQRSIYENYNREGMHLLDYYDSVKNNKRLLQQATKAVEDVEIITNTILQSLEG